MRLINQFHRFLFKLWLFCCFTLSASLTLMFADRKNRLSHTKYILCFIEQPPATIIDTNVRLAVKVKADCQWLTLHTENWSMFTNITNKATNTFSLAYAAKRTALFFLLLASSKFAVALFFATLVFRVSVYFFFCLIDKLFCERWKYHRVHSCVHFAHREVVVCCYIYNMDVELCRERFVDLFVRIYWIKRQIVAYLKISFISN